MKRRPKPEAEPSPDEVRSEISLMALRLRRDAIMSGDSVIRDIAEQMTALSEAEVPDLEEARRLHASVPWDRAAWRQ